MIASPYTFETRLSDDLCNVIHLRYGRQMWSKVKMRKIANCMVTGKPLGMGSVVYSPVTNSCNRGDRISQEGMTLLEAKDG